MARVCKSKSRMISLSCSLMESAFRGLQGEIALFTCRDLIKSNSDKDSLNAQLNSIKTGSCYEREKRTVMDSIAV